MKKKNIYTLPVEITFSNGSFGAHQKATNDGLNRRFVPFCMNIVHALFYALLLKVSHSKGFEAFEVMLHHRLR
ncbi:hypothetical protein AEA09_09160 [Lysinibacillus contaminans]|uniref:Uncharacterized protein n=1 Tax=Lysinibacillus contaminans TaxID=1293441 RepID=A0ABR5K1A1_9BACI|nr:hypothetical protein [Lysinibacillus contaminans]KOS68692.1 hypothetical protein AEA09_09160 [Lysinibacillus contaminans]